MLIIAGWKRRNWNRVPNLVALMAFLLLGASVIGSSPMHAGGAGMPDSAQTTRQETAPESTVREGAVRTEIPSRKRAEPRLILFRHG